jgi:hypothetical protein
MQKYVRKYCRRMRRYFSRYVLMTVTTLLEVLGLTTDSCCLLNLRHSVVTLEVECLSSHIPMWHDQRYLLIFACEWLTAYAIEMLPIKC